MGEAFIAIVEFQNPYNFALENVQLRLDAPGLLQTKMKSYKYAGLQTSLLFPYPLIFSFSSEIKKANR